MASSKGDRRSEPKLMANEALRDSAALRGSRVVSGSTASPHVVVFGLIRKEMQQHTKTVSGLMGLFVLISGLAALALRDDPLNAYLMGMSVVPILALLPMQLGQWLIGNERLQRTIKFLKMLPLRAEQVVAAKFASAWLFITLSWLLSCFLPWVVAIYVYKMSSFVSFQFLFITYLLSILSAALCMTTHFLSEKQAPAYFLFAVLMILFAAILAYTKVGFVRRFFTSVLVESTARQIVGWSIVVAGFSLAVLVGLYKLSVQGYRRINS